jgi:hypothetical protein
MMADMSGPMRRDAIVCVNQLKDWLTLTAMSSLPLRILYTINSSPQYILARSHTSFPVDFIPSSSTHAYGSTSLKHCLHTICMSSPELIQDTSRDFSVYVLDPLESNSAPAPVQISNSSAQAADTGAMCGVAVGFGLMSWALRSDDNSIKAVGTVVRSAAQEFLEVVFALREVRNNFNPPLPWLTICVDCIEANTFMGTPFRPLSTNISVCRWQATREPIT